MLFEGVVESDTEIYGYCRVRIFGKHTDDKTILPTTDLPLAKILYSGESNVDEISYFRTIKAGSWVLIDFLDEDQQNPIVMGSIVKDVEELPDFTKGFSDTDSNHPSTDYLDESTISRLARNENISDTIVQDKIDDIETGIVCGLVTFDEPTNEYNTTYPFNRVLQTEKHIIEIDDTEGSERINIYHNSGSFIEFNPDGTIIEKCKGEKFLSIADDLNIVVHGNCNLKSDNDINVQGTNVIVNSTTATITSPTVTANSSTSFSIISPLINLTGAVSITGVAGITGLLTTAGIANTGQMVSGSKDVGDLHVHPITWTDPAGSGSSGPVS